MSEQMSRAESWQEKLHGMRQEDENAQDVLRLVEDDAFTIISLGSATLYVFFDKSALRVRSSPNNKGLFDKRTTALPNLKQAESEGLYLILSPKSEQIISTDGPDTPFADMGPKVETQYRRFASCAAAGAFIDSDPQRRQFSHSYLIVPEQKLENVVSDLLNGEIRRIVDQTAPRDVADDLFSRRSAFESERREREAVEDVRHTTAEFPDTLKGGPDTQ